MVLQSLIRTFFLETSLDTLFQHLPYFGTRTLTPGEIAQEDLREGMRLTRIVQTSSHVRSLSFIYDNCTIVELQGFFIRFEFEGGHAVYETGELEHFANGMKGYYGNAVTIRYYF